jgi:hypothetical protein
MSQSDGFTADNGNQPQPQSTPQITSDAKAAFPWKRLIYSFVFGLFFWVVAWFALLLVAVQFVIVAHERKPSEDLTRVLMGIGTYLRDVLAYMSFASDQKPFPFSPLPKIN